MEERQTVAAKTVFLDFEASSLAKNGFPVEVAWVFEDGRGEAHLIRPAPGWTDWDQASEAIHGISREQLEAEGRPYDWVAGRMLDALGGHRLYASAPSWDGKWLSLLLRAAGLPRHALRLFDTEEAQYEAAAAAFAARLGPADLRFAVGPILADMRAHAWIATPAHRALADAEAERQLWLEVKRRAEEAAQEL